MEVHQCLWNWQLAHVKGRYESCKVYAGPDDVFFREGFAYKNSRRVWLLKLLACNHKMKIVHFLSLNS